MNVYRYMSNPFLNALLLFSSIKSIASVFFLFINNSLIFSSIYSTFLPFVLLFLLSFTQSKMKFNPFTSGPKFVDLLQSQQSIFGSSEVPVYGTPHSVGSVSVVEGKERRAWTPADDILLISAWLNTSKDPVVGNEQRSGAFWKRIAAYFAASQKAEGSKPRESTHYKQRWQKINDLVCKFCGSYEAATREKTSGQNETDVLKKAHEIFYNNHQKKFNLEHAWMELRNDQKWCDLSSSKLKRKVADAGAETEADECTSRPPGVKAAKARGKKAAVVEKGVAALESLWTIKQADLASKERLSKMALLDRLIAKEGPLNEREEALKTRLIDELLVV
ncbi:glutathione S-transferase T3-like [Brassica napus]|uniref:glutathione S-transferase T3-like n=1 Tax=Brassica napus TaxID=3708 RepID=UPI002078FA57|nr:glutathione S-transferase T3-like [Brassica napus]XP_048625617.1 glutathione S-transferase T3-like [Brassica napus]